MTEPISPDAIEMPDTPDLPRITPLSPQDAEVLDALMAIRASGASSGPMPSVEPERVEKVEALLGLLGQADTVLPGEEPSEDLVQQTMAKLDEARQRARFAEQVEMLSTPQPTTGVGIRQVLTAAAVFLLSLSLLLPILERNKQNAWKTECQNNLSHAGRAFGQYAASSQGLLPRLDTQPGQDWWHIGQNATGEQPPQVVRSNTANLHLLIQADLIAARQLACPTNQYADSQALAAVGGPGSYDWHSPQQLSYSYQNQFTPEPMRLDADPSMALLADKNPIFLIQRDRLAINRRAHALSASEAHNERGQNVLLASGGVLWSSSPVVDRGPGRGQDNIWLLQDVDFDQYRGNEYADDGLDSFLAP